MNLIFRPLDPQNANDIAQFNALMDDLTCHAADQELLRHNVAAANANPDKYLMVAEDTDTGALCGSLFSMVFDDFCDQCRPVMLVENVVTGSQHRGKGVARAMFAAIEDWGRSKQAAYIILCSGNNRHAAHQFYKAIGYEEIKGFKKYL